MYVTCINNDGFPILKVGTNYVIEPASHPRYCSVYPPLSGQLLCVCSRDHFIEYRVLNNEMSNECQHSFKEYIGFTESYKYCTKCNIKGERI
jgi:hypothetical protein